MPHGDTPSAEPEKAPQEIAFDAIMDLKTGKLTVPLGAAEGRAALQKLNDVTVETFQLLTDARMYSVGTTLCQGACLLVAVFQALGLLESAWSGPDADLSDLAVKIPLQLTGGKKKTVRFALPVR